MCSITKDLNGHAALVTTWLLLRKADQVFCLLQKYRQILDIPRLCTALAIREELAEIFIKAGKL